ncbi:MAG: hypothetical protein HUJ26_04525 [Planctomycetaceae bacterium]|nr:hypothetical protein [Planctomycetaceae bacterium]
MSEPQTSDSQTIAATFHVLRRFCHNVALLLEASENLFIDDYNWKSALSYNLCVGGNSESLENPMQWFPTRFFRCYTPKDHPEHMAYVSVLFDLPDGQEMTDGQTLLTAGLLTHESEDGWAKFRKDYSQYFKWHLLRDDRVDTAELTIHTPYRWNTKSLPYNWEKNSRRIKQAKTLGVSIDRVTDSEGLQKIVKQLVDAI